MANFPQIAESPAGRRFQQFKAEKHCACGLQQQHFKISS
jgi:hypothetical protein